MKSPSESTPDVMIRRLQLELAAAKRRVTQLQLTRDDFEILQAGGAEALNKAREQRDTYRNEAAQAKAERDDALSKTDELTQLLNYYLNLAAERLQTEIAAFEDICQQVDKSLEEKEVSYFVHTLLAISDRIAKGLQSEWAETNSIVRARLDHDYSTHEYPAKFVKLLEHADAVANYNLANVIVQFAFHFADDTRAVAWEILQECKRDGKPQITTLQRLGESWVKQHLDKAPTLNRLQKGLSMHYARIRGGKNQTEFVATLTTEGNYHSERTLRIYESWYKVLENVALQSVEDLLSGKRRTKPL